MSVVFDELLAFEAAMSPIGALVPVEPSAAVAKHRLRHIIAADREAVPAWRWVKKMDQCVTLVLGESGLKRAIWPPRKLCRWERCR